MFRIFFIFIIFISAAFSDLAAGFSKYLPASKDPASDQLEQIAQDEILAQTPSDALKKQVIALWQEQMPNLFINELTFRENVPPNCQINTISAPKTKGFIRLICGQKSQYLHYELDAFVRALLLNIDLNAGEEISPTAIRSTRLPLLASNANLLAQLPDGAKARTRLRANTLLKPTHLAPNWLILKGANVNLRHDDGGLSVFTTAKALSNATLNQTLKLRLPNGKTINAKAKGINFAEVF